ncbi:MAG: DUF1573 domain-containing protein [Chitinophagales bacterium]
MKNLLLLISLSLFTGLLFAQSEGPTMDFEFSTYDFGELAAGDDASVEFTFTNNGTKPLIITNVKASCGCTTPYWSKEPVAPGEEGTIKAKYNTVGKNGGFNKPITITSNAEPSTTRIFIKGNVTPASQSDGVPEKKQSIVKQED